MSGNRGVLSFLTSGMRRRHYAVIAATAAAAAAASVCAAHVMTGESLIA